MTKSCSVKNCPSGRHTDRKHRSSKNLRQISLFRLPKCPIKQEQWCKILSLEPTSHTVVCELHFDEKDVLSEDSFIIQGEKKTMPRGKYTLKSDAIPIPNARLAPETPREALEPSNFDETSLEDSEQLESEDSVRQPGQSLLKQSTRKHQVQVLKDKTTAQLLESQQLSQSISQLFRKILPKPTPEKLPPKNMVLTPMPLPGKPLVLGTLSTSSGVPIRPLILQPVAKGSAQSQLKQVTLQSAVNGSSLVNQPKQLILQSAKQETSNQILQLHPSQSSLIKISPLQLPGKPVIKTSATSESPQLLSNKSDESDTHSKKSHKRYTIKLVKPAPSKLMIESRAQNKPFPSKKPRILRPSLSKPKPVPLQLVIVRRENQKERDIQQQNEDPLEERIQTFEEISDSVMEIPLEIHDEFEQKGAVELLDHCYEQQEHLNGIFAEEEFDQQDEPLSEGKPPFEKISETILPIEIPEEIQEELEQKQTEDSLEHSFEQNEQLNGSFSEEEFIDHEELSDDADGLEVEFQAVKYDQQEVIENSELMQVLREKLQKKLQSFREKSSQAIMQQQQSEEVLQESVLESADCDMNSDSAFYSTDESPQKAVLSMDTIKDHFKMLPESWCYVVNESVITFIYFNRYNLKERIRLKITSDLCVVLSVGGVKDIDLNDRIESIDDLYIYFKLVEDSEVCSGTGIDCDKYSIDCNGILTNDERYQRQQTYPRCKPCRLLRQRIQSRISYYQNTRFKQSSSRKRKKLLLLDDIKKEIKEEGEGNTD